MSEFDDYLSLVRRLGTGGINRSENDLSSNLKNALAGFGLYGVIDTGAGSNRSKRPDVALYVNRDAADVGSAADIIVESKKPAEIAQFATLLDALTDDALWYDKFVPYVAAHAERITYFFLTTFERFLVVTISAAMRSGVQTKSAYPNGITRRAALEATLNFDLRLPDGEAAFRQWCQGHLAPQILSPPSLSSISDIRLIDSAESLEVFASALADVVAGPEGHIGPSGALVATVRLAGSWKI